MCVATGDGEEESPTLLFQLLNSFVEEPVLARALLLAIHSLDKTPLGIALYPRHFGGRLTCLWGLSMAATLSMLLSLSYIFPFPFASVVCMSVSLSVCPLFVCLSVPLSVSVPMWGWWEWVWV